MDAGLLLEPRVPGELRERAEGVTAEGARSLRHVVDDVVQLLVLRLEELVQVVELGTDDVPMLRVLV
jgi:hypothetical protein